MNNRINVGGKEFKIAKRTKVVSRDERKRDKQRPSLIEARQIYEQWKKEFCATPCLPNQIPGRILAMRDVMAAKIKNRRVRITVLDMIDLSYRKAVANYGQPEATKKCEICERDFVPMEGNNSKTCEVCQIYTTTKEEGDKE